MSDDNLTTINNITNSENATNTGKTVKVVMNIAPQLALAPSENQINIQTQLNPKNSPKK